MIELLIYAAGIATGAGVLYLRLKPRLDYLARITDRDERGRFVKREP